MAVFTLVAAETPSNVAAVAAISAAVFFAGGASGMSWALASVAAPTSCTASLGSIQNFGGYLGGALAPIVTGYIVQETGTFDPALLVAAPLPARHARALLDRGVGQIADAVHARGVPRIGRYEIGHVGERNAARRI